MTTLEHLERLIAFPTVSADPNIALIDYVAQCLRAVGADVQILPNESGQKANLYATIGPADRPGVLLSGHTDVVPVAGQDWQVPPFELTQQEDRVYGRGTTDMKGFVAAALAAAERASHRNLTTPLHLAFSFDEEVGCLGVRSLIAMLKDAPFCPLLCIVGEPTELAVATGHKGKTAFRVTCHGVAAHSALAPTGLNALYLAADLIAEIRAIQAEIAESGASDPDYDVPYTTLHVGTMSGGEALNIVPNRAEFLAEFRTIADDDPTALMAQVTAAANRVADAARPRFPSAGFEFAEVFSYPPLDTAPGAQVVDFVKSLTGANRTNKVAFGTEGGRFSQDLGIPTVVCGPGSMEQGHKADEFITLGQLSKCDAMLDALIDRLTTGI